MSFLPTYIRLFLDTLCQVNLLIEIVSNCIKNRVKNLKIDGFQY